MKTTINVTQSLIDLHGPSGAVVEAIQQHLVPGAMVLPGMLNLLFYPDDGAAGADAFTQLPRNILDWLNVADRGEDEMRPISFEVEIPARYAARESRLAA